MQTLHQPPARTQCPEWIRFKIEINSTFRKLKKGLRRRRAWFVEGPEGRPA
jgi:lipoate synthase